MLDNVDTNNNGFNNAGLASTRVKWLECPSDPAANGEPQSYQAGGNHFYSRRSALRASYFFNAGGFTDYNAKWSVYSRDVRRGPFGNDGAARMADIRDGTSNSFMIGEGAGDSGNNQKWSYHYGPWGLTGLHTGVHGRIPGTSSTRVAHNANYPAQWGINGIYSAADTKKRSYAWTFNSHHPGTAGFVMCDGAVKFIPEVTQYIVQQRLAYIADGDPVEVP